MWKDTRHVERGCLDTFITWLVPGTLRLPSLLVLLAKFYNSTETLRKGKLVVGWTKDPSGSMLIDFILHAPDIPVYVITTKVNIGLKRSCPPVAGARRYLSIQSADPFFYKHVKAVN